MANTTDSPIIDISLVRGLIADQFPQWNDLPIMTVKVSGHDNRTFHLGTNMSVRMPSAERYAAHVRIEHTWLPKLSTNLPLPIPAPLGMGLPGFGYPWPWTVNRWLPGESASVSDIEDLVEFAKDLANFLNILQSIDTRGAPTPGKHNFHRGGDLSVYSAETRTCIDFLQPRIDADLSTKIWESALAAVWDRPPVWIHGDIAAGNLLVERGRLSAVIDFGQLAAGDPSCDVTIAWTFFSGRSREVFISELNADEGTWIRGRGWALWKALLMLRECIEHSLPQVVQAEHLIHQILSD